MKISKKKLKALIRDEGKASKEYDKLGLHNLARDEASHKVFLQNLKNNEKIERVGNKIIFTPKDQDPIGKVIEDLDELWEY